MRPTEDRPPAHMEEGEVAAVWANVEALTPDPRNPRDNAAAVEKVAASIKRFGFASPIVAREADGMVIAGHTRLAAAISLGLDMVPVRFVDLDPADARLLNLADNRLAELADWSADLGPLLAELRAEGAELEGLGWSEGELDALLGELSGGEGGGAGGAGDLPSPPIAGSAERHAPHLINGEALAALRALPDCSIDAVIVDPPYGLGFLGKKWDAPGMEWTEAWAAECLRVMKPGAFLLAWASDRTDHRIKVALEDAGFEIRRTFAWVTWQSFPKSLAADLAIDRHLGRLDDRPVIRRSTDGITGGTGKHAGVEGSYGFAGEYDVTGPASEEARRWYGYGTDVRTANEPAVLARKPMEGTLAENLIKWGCGALHLDACRFAPGDPMWLGPKTEAWATHAGGARPGEGPTVAIGSTGYTPGSSRVETNPKGGRAPASLLFCPKVSTKEREWGTEGLAERRPPGKEGRADGSAGTRNPRAGAGRKASSYRNNHPTLKPIALCRWFVRLLAPRPGSVILDTFAGSGSGVVAGIVEGHRMIAVEREGDEPDAETGSAGLGYFAILEARTAAAMRVAVGDLDAVSAAVDSSEGEAGDTLEEEGGSDGEAGTG